MCNLCPAFFPSRVLIDKELRTLKSRLIINSVENKQTGYENRASSDLIQVYNYAPYATLVIIVTCCGAYLILCDKGNGGLTCMLT